MEMTALIVGANASLAQPLCRELAKRGATLILAGRDLQEIEILAGDLRARYGATCGTLAADFLSTEFSAQNLLDAAGEITHLILATGDLGGGGIGDVDDIARIAHINYIAPAQIAALAAANFAEHGGGDIVIISSIAGDRGRAVIGAYGSAKAALTAFASALRQGYSKRGVRVLTVKPGFIDTKMTWGMKSPLMVSPDYAAKKIIAAMVKKKDVAYIPGFWRIIMLVIQHIPERIFKRLSF
jgi:decaprenylphospho-beta-D-erythro-pentofuranosid-2-ulose 2-reductase